MSDVSYVFILTVAPLLYIYLQGNQTELCKNCKGTYGELNKLYNRLDKSLSLCIDMEDSVWRFTIMDFKISQMIQCNLYSLHRCVIKGINRIPPHACWVNLSQNQIALKCNLF